MSKGSNQRPELVKGSYAANYDKIFRKSIPGDNGSVVKPGNSKPGDSDIVIKLADYNG